MTNLERMYVEMEGVSEPEIGSKQVYAKVIVDILKNVDKRHLDVLHYVVDNTSIKGIKGITDYKSTDIFALKEYLLSLIDNDYCDAEEELWLHLSLNELKFITQAVNVLKKNADVASNLLKNIRRGLVKYPFDRAYMY